MKVVLVQVCVCSTCLHAYMYVYVIQNKHTMTNEVLLQRYICICDQRTSDIDQGMYTYNNVSCIGLSMYITVCYNVGEIYCYLRIKLLIAEKLVKTFLSSCNTSDKDLWMKCSGY